ncbi:replication protein A 32 kDa subunit-B-like [Chanos chanos]|uniref:Replication protein A 32 kDa subunit-B-like n=1 Tax=Chanos chanos TaxID=29144 RepID=A0A6J2WLQ0_CHACN|nr:replication protein A 32 kDa subunit-B-like [Chanos chanos]
MGSKGHNYSHSPRDTRAPEKGERFKGKSRISPCTVSQLLSASETKDVFLIGEAELFRVTLVGVIRRAVPSVTDIQYTLDDMTGPPLNVKQWIDLEETGLEELVIPCGAYVKVTGNLRSFQRRRTLLALCVRRIDDLNEITSHMLEVVQAHMLIGCPSPDTVLEVIRSCPDHEGISLQILMNRLRRLSQHDISRSLQFLIGEGHIFSTIDGNHFKSTYG